MRKVLVAGATGALGRHVAAALEARGWTVRALARDAERARRVKGVAEVHVGDALDAGTLAGAFEGVEAAFSCVGASIDPSPFKGWSSYLSVDVPANVHLIDAAKAAGVGRFAYVSLHHDEAMRRTLRYVDAHARVEEHLRASGLDGRVLRPTGFFSAFGMLFEMAKRGAAPLMGDGTARTNPISDLDLAEVCADAVEGATPLELPLGGPEELSRREAVELAFQALGKPPRVVEMPVGAVRAMCAGMAPFFPRTADITRFVAHVSANTCCAPPRGSRTLSAYYRGLAAGSVAVMLRGGRSPPDDRAR